MGFLPNAPDWAKPFTVPFDPLNVGGENGNYGINPNTKQDVNTAGGQPGVPNYIVGYDPSTMSLTDYLQGKYDHSGIDAFKADALRTGPSHWATLANQDQTAQASNQREQSAAQANSQTAQAEDDLAARGGLSSGARERAVTEGSKNYLSMAQGIGRTETMNHMQIGMNDEQNRVQELSQLPGMLGQQASMWEGAKGQDIANTTAENQRRNAYNQNLYNQQMAAWGAAKQADATQNSGKK